MAQLKNWTPDDTVTCCKKCSSKFSVINRRHHCRACGEIFCSKCSVWKEIVPQISIKKRVRLCHLCYRVMNIVTSLKTLKKQYHLIRPGTYTNIPQSSIIQTHPLSSFNQISRSSPLPTNSPPSLQTPQSIPISIPRSLSTEGSTSSASTSSNSSSSSFSSVSSSNIIRYIFMSPFSSTPSVSIGGTDDYHYKINYKTVQKSATAPTTPISISRNHKESDERKAGGSMLDMLKFSTPKTAKVGGSSSFYPNTIIANSFCHVEALIDQPNEGTYSSKSPSITIKQKHVEGTSDEGNYSSSDSSLSSNFLNDSLEAISSFTQPTVTETQETNEKKNDESIQTKETESESESESNSVLEPATPTSSQNSVSSLIIPSAISSTGCLSPNSLRKTREQIIEQCVSNLLSLLKEDNRSGKLFLYFGRSEFNFLSSFSEKKLEVKISLIFLNLSRSENCLPLLIEDEHFLQKLSSYCTSSREQIHKTAFHILENISKIEKGRNVIVSSFLDLLVKLASSHSFDRALHLPLASILSSIVFQGPKTVDLIESGMYQVVVEMFTLSRHPLLQKLLLNLLLYLMKLPSKSSKAREKFVEESGLFPLVSLFSTTKDPGIIRSCAQIIVYLSEDDRTRESVLDAGTIHVLCSILQENNVSEIQTYCTKALKYLAMVDQESLESVLSNLQSLIQSLISLLQSPLHNHYHKNKIQTPDWALRECVSVLSVLTQLVSYDVFRHALIQNEALLESLRKSRENQIKPQIVHLCSSLLTHLQQ